MTLGHYHQAHGVSIILLSCVCSSPTRVLFTNGRKRLLVFFLDIFIFVQLCIDVCMCMYVCVWTFARAAHVCKQNKARFFFIFFCLISSYSS